MARVPILKTTRKIDETLKAAYDFGTLLSKERHKQKQHRLLGYYKAQLESRLRNEIQTSVLARDLVDLLLY
jgi:hypothetical protein